MSIFNAGEINEPTNSSSSLPLIVKDSIFIKKGEFIPNLKDDELLDFIVDSYSENHIATVDNVMGNSAVREDIISYRFLLSNSPTYTNILKIKRKKLTSIDVDFLKSSFQEVDSVKAVEQIINNIVPSKFLACQLAILSLPAEFNENNPTWSFLAKQVFCSSTYDAEIWKALKHALLSANLIEFKRRKVLRKFK